MGEMVRSVSRWNCSRCPASDWPTCFHGERTNAKDPDALDPNPGERSLEVQIDSLTSWSDPRFRAVSFTSFQETSVSS